MSLVYRLTVWRAGVIVHQHEAEGISETAALSIALGHAHDHAPAVCVLDWKRDSVGWMRTAVVASGAGAVLLGKDLSTALLTADPKDDSRRAYMTANITHRTGCRFKQTGSPADCACDE